MNQTRRQFLPPVRRVHAIEFLSWLPLNSMLSFPSGTLLNTANLPISEILNLFYTQTVSSNTTHTPSQALDLQYLHEIHTLIHYD